jgi:hypothetical protein
MTQQEIYERDVFCGFLAASQLPIDPVSIESRHPPEPDIRAALRDQLLFFELSEILWEDLAADPVNLAHGFAQSEDRARARAALVAAGDIAEADRIQTLGTAPYPPLWSVIRTLDKKCRATYQTSGLPIHLLLYFERQTPIEPFARLAGDYQGLVRDLLLASPFTDVWLYHHATDYRFDLTAMRSRELSVPLTALHTPESQRSVIGHIVQRRTTPQISLDVRYSDRFDEIVARLTSRNTEQIDSLAL